ncbi:alanine racemase [Nocardiopsis akebiae]|uniref:Alanine racemase n=1 Tax=Nocardiopsis akebiae TaxID=2831968 RepID=A0ABX8C3Q7_9ACTN|nr:alanine racemase [Nocardiopsis akebiae]QUX29012.1 alanine racemase [Nocardiopsis akebiae]
MPSTDPGERSLHVPGHPASPLGEALVDISAIAHNVRFMAKRTNSEILAVVKANGFGHGAVEVARASLEAGATWLGVTSLEEALALRRAGLRAPVLCWLHRADQDFDSAVAADVDLSVPSVGHLRAVADAAVRTGRVAHVHLKADTGLSRNGAPPEAWPGLVGLARVLELDGLVRVRGVWSHLASADLPGAATTAQQVTAFEGALSQARAAGLDPSLRHLANTAAILNEPATHFDLVRAGVGLYGVEPVEGRRFGLRLAMTLRARVAMVRRVPAGTGVSYHHAYTTSRESLLALVPLGYADGVPRAAGDRAYVWIAGRRCPVAGRIAMDQFVVDVGGVDVREGDEVVVFGPGDRGEPTVEEWADWAGTIPHEILTGVGARVPRLHQDLARPVPRVPSKERSSA